MKKHIAYYISSHGYGHGVRSAAICNSFSKDVALTIRTMLPEQFFYEELERPFRYVPGEFDCGCIQSDSITVDIEKTLRTYMKIADENEKKLEEEVRWCRENNISCIVSDIAPFPFEVAENADIPSVAVSNFSWTDIYEAYLSQIPEFIPYFEKIGEQYDNADLLLALSPSNNLINFSGRRLEMSLVGRPPPAVMATLR